MCMLLSSDSDSAVVFSNFVSVVNMFFFFKQKTAYEIVRSRGLGDVYKRQR